MKHLKGEPSPTNRYTCEVAIPGDIVFHEGGPSYEGAIWGRECWNGFWSVVAYESLPDDHPFKDPEHPYHTDYDENGVFIPEDKRMGVKQ